MSIYRSRRAPQFPSGNQYGPKNPAKRSDIRYFDTAGRRSSCQLPADKHPAANRRNSHIRVPASSRPSVTPFAASGKPVPSVPRLALARFPPSTCRRSTPGRENLTSLLQEFIFYPGKPAAPPPRPAHSAAVRLVLPRRAITPTAHGSKK